MNTVRYGSSSRRTRTRHHGYRGTSGQSQQNRSRVNVRQGMTNLAHDDTELDTLHTRRHRPDYVLVLIMVALLVVSVVTLFAIGPGVSRTKELPDNYYSTRQMVAVIMGLGAFSLGAFIRTKIWRRYAFLLPSVAVVLAFALRVPGFGTVVFGSYRWSRAAVFTLHVPLRAKCALLS